MQKYIAELIGTFLLALAVSLSVAGQFPVSTPVVAALTLGVCVYTMGAISGTHINPAITIGLAMLRKISPKDAAAYLVAQFAGAGLAIAMTRFLAATPAVTAVDSAPTFVAEIIGTFVLAFGVASVVHDKAPGGAAGLTIGGSLLIGISIAASASNGVLNPAVAMAIGSMSAAYAAGPIVGAVLAMFLYAAIASTRPAS